MLTLLALLGPFVPPQVAPKDTTLVTATRIADELLELPFAAETLEQERLLRRSYRTVPQALRDVPGVLVQETSPGQGSPYLRGVTGYRNVLLIDGIRLNHSAFRDGPNQYWNTVDPLGLERIEVVKGPGSVLYGSDAIGGVVEVTTRAPRAGRDGPWYGRVHERVSSAERSHLFRVEGGGQFGDWGVLLGAGGKLLRHVRGGEDIGTQENTGYRESNGDLKLEHWLGDDTWVTFAYQQVKQNDVPRTHSTIYAEPFEGTTVGSDLRRDLDQERRLSYAQLHSLEREGFVDELHLSLSWQSQEESRDRIRGSLARDLQGFDVDTLGALATFGAQGLGGRLTFGFDYYHDSVDSFSSTNPIQGPVGDDASYDLAGVFLQDELELSPEFTLTLGVRFEYAAAQADSVQDPTGPGVIQVDDDWSQLVGSARALYRLDDTQRLFLGVSQGYRAPNLSDLTRFDSARTNEFEIPAPGLDPEQALAYELGYRTETARHRAEVSLFYTDLEDTIVRFPTGNTNPAGEFEITKDNVGDGHVYGLELAGAVRVAPQWSLFCNATYMRGRADTFPTSAPVIEEEYIDRLMPPSAQLGLGWEEPDGELWGEGVVRFADDADRLSSRDAGDTSRIPPGGTPGYLLFDLRGGWSLREGLRLEVALENLLNEDYRVHGSGSNAPGRNLIVGLTFEL